MDSWMQLIVEEKCAGKGKMEGSTCGGISTVETCFEPVSEGLLKLAGSADFEPTGEELWRRRIALIPPVSECCPWATIDARTLHRALGRYAWVAEGREAGDSVEVRSQASDDSYDAGSLVTMPPKLEAEARHIDDATAQKLEEYTAIWVQRLRMLVAEEIAAL